MVRLRDIDCPGMWTFRVRIYELTYADEKEAQEALERLNVIRNEHDSWPVFKRLHRFWSEGPTVYLAFSMAHKHRKRFRTFLDLCGVN